jgi:DNA adenine methylase
VAGKEDPVLKADVNGALNHEHRSKCEGWTANGEGKFRETLVSRAALNNILAIPVFAPNHPAVPRPPQKPRHTLSKQFASYPLPRNSQRTGPAHIGSAVEATLKLQREHDLPVEDQELLNLPSNGSILRAEAQPFLKWAGGKTQLLTQLDPFLPTSIHSYAEPFVGGGAVFFHLKARMPRMHALLCDNNEEVINAFVIVRDDPERLMGILDAHLFKYEKDPKYYYYLVRNQHRLFEPAEAAARVVFLNKTCFNGLWRVNGRGEFNVPIGSYRKVTLYDRQNILAAHQALQGTDVRVQDFRETLRRTAKGDFLYLDPPYHPLSRTSAFTAYTKDDFGEAEQDELAALFADAANRGVRLILSNSDTKFIRNLYRDFLIHPVRARRAINCRGEGRGTVSEVVITSYEPANS